MLMPEPLRSLPSNLQHFNRLLTEYSKAEGGMPVARARHAIGVVVICSIVDRVRTDDGGYLFVTKGGSAMQMRLGLTARATTDLDFLFRGGASEWLDHLDDALLGGAWNGFDVHRKNEPIEIEVLGLRYKPWRMNLQLAYKGKAFSTVQVEIAVDSVSGVDRDDTVEGIDLGWFGIDAPPIPCLSIAYQMAQKLHACTDPYNGEGQQEDDRVRDLVDLWLLESLLDTNGLADVRAGVLDTFDRRAKQAWPPTPVVTETWLRDYPKVAHKVIGSPATVEAAAKYVTGLMSGFFEHCGRS
jgi:Nucleotidyl transferase AbiEii toxin, Type IV TA system